MAKAKSVKMRTLLTLHALFKYSDVDHRLNTAKLNAHLHPYGLDCTCWTLQSFIQSLRELGIDIRSKGTRDNRGFWLEDRPLPEHKLKQLIFAIDTNPYLSKSQATELLEYLKPFVTVYQEELLQGIVDAEQNTEDDSLYRTYSVIREAISAKRKVFYTEDHLKYDKKTQSVAMCPPKPVSFTPKFIRRVNDQLFMVGFDKNQHPSEVNLKSISSIRVVRRKGNTTDHNPSDINLQNLLPGKCILYNGTAVFICRAQYIGDLYNHFGPPIEPVTIDVQGRLTYAVKGVEITPETLLWLSEIPDCGVKIAGPEALVETVRDYYSQTVSALTESP